MNRKNAGFTIIELMIVLLVIPIVTGVVAVGLIEHERAYAGLAAEQEMAGEARNVMKWVGRDVRQAGAVLPQAGSYAASAGALVLSGPGGKGAVVWTVDRDVLKRIEFSDPAGAPTAEQAFTAPGARLELDAPAGARQVGVRLTCSRQLLEERREFGLSGRFGLKGAAQ